jgi:hypothetical protein
MAVLTQIGGADLKRFVMHSALLWLIDPVRGKPTRTSLDENPDGDISGGQQLKQKFLDSFALICSTSKSGAETAAAVCLEQNPPAGSILRVARNRGLTPEALAGLERVLQTLRLVAKKGTYFIRNFLRHSDRRAIQKNHLSKPSPRFSIWLSNWTEVGSCRLPRRWRSVAFERLYETRTLGFLETRRSQKHGQNLGSNFGSGVVLLLPNHCRPGVPRLWPS